jgi:hypothetical protein
VRWRSDDARPEHHSSRRTGTFGDLEKRMHAVGRD